MCLISSTQRNDQGSFTFTSIQRRLQNPGALNLTLALPGIVGNATKSSPATSPAHNATNPKAGYTIDAAQILYQLNTGVDLLSEGDCCRRTKTQ